MSPRTGRPKALEPKTVEVKARIDVKTNERLNQYCEKHNVTRTDVVRKGIDSVLENEKEKSNRPRQALITLPYHSQRSDKSILSFSFGRINRDFRL